VRTHLLAAIAPDACGVIEDGGLFTEVYGSCGTDLRAYAAEPAGAFICLRFPHENGAQQFLDGAGEAPVCSTGSGHREGNRGRGQTQIDDLVFGNQTMAGSTGGDGQDRARAKVAFDKGVKSEGATGKADYAAGDRITARWPIATHAEDTVEDRYRRGGNTVDVHDNGGKKIPVPSGAKMPASFGKTAYETEGVLHSQRHAHHAMCFQLGGVNDEVVSGRILAEEEFPVRRYALCAFHDLLVKRRDTNPQVAEHFGVAAVFQDSFQRLKSGTVPEEHRTGVVFQGLNECSEKEGVGCDGPLRRLARKEVGFYEDGTMRNVKTDAAKTLFKKFLELFRVIGVTPSHYHFFQAISPGRN